MTTLISDVKYAFHMLTKKPGFTAIALLTLAIGIGANTVMFSVSDRMLFHQTEKVKAPEQLAYCGIKGGKDKHFRYSEYQTLRENNTVFSDVMAQIGIHDRGTLVHDGSAWDVWMTYVSPNFFSMLGATPVYGRGFLPAEEQPDSAPVVVLSYHCWQRLGGDPEIVGQFVNLVGVACQIIGVAPKDFTGASLNGYDIWLPTGNLRSVCTLYRNRPNQKASYYVVGRLKPKMTMATAKAQLRTLVPRFNEQDPERWPTHASIFAQRPGRWNISGDFEQDRQLHMIFCLVLMTPAAIILLIACLNLGNMLIVQGASRAREIAVRMALGGGRWRIVRQLLVESALLATLGGLVGIFLAYAGMQLVNTWLTTIPAKDANIQIVLNTRVLAATLGVCGLTILLFGLRPALWLSKRDLVSQMKTSGTSVLGSRRRKRGGLSVTGQVALAVALVLSATLLTRSAAEAARPDRHFPLADKLVVQIDPSAAGYDRARCVEVSDSVVHYLESLPEIQTVGTSYGVFFGGGGHVDVGEYKPENEASGPRGTVAKNAAYVNIGPDYFKAMEVPLLRGRFFNELDRQPDAEKVIIIDESLARKLRPDGNALDCLIQWKFLSDSSDPYRVVGVVAHLPGVNNHIVYPQMYFPQGADDWAKTLYLHVAEGVSAKHLQGQIYDDIHRVDPQMPILSVTTLAQKRYNHQTVWLARFGARLALTAGAAALFLAALGIYAIKGYMVASRTPEIGVRMALGATHNNVVGMVLREGILLTLIGSTIGLAVGLGVAKVAARFLYGISPIDPVSIIVTITLLGTASLLAGLIPARRAAKIDPMMALRYE